MKRWHVLVAAIVVIVLPIILLIGIPYYSQWLEHRDMRYEVEWAETWHRVHLTLPPGTDINEYILMRKIEDTDLEELK